MSFLSALLAAGVARGTPILVATLGEILAERAGVLNLGVEGLMLLGAMAGFGAAHLTGSAALGVAAAMLAAGALALIHAFATVSLRADAVVSGLAVAFAGSGIAAVAGAPLVEVRQAAARLPHLRVPGLADVPFVGPIFFDQNAVVVLGFALVPAIWWWIHRTRPGLHLRAAGENPAAADALGVRVVAIRYAYTVAGGMLAGLAGASLSLAVTPGWVEGMTAGQGWVAVGLVVFARWSPWRAALGAYLFGAVRRLPLDLQGLASLPFARDPNLGYFLDMLPYLFVIAALVLGSRAAARRRLGAPSALGRPFARGERE
jgi:simple sugar transport system permease protein